MHTCNKVPACAVSGLLTSTEITPKRRTNTLLATRVTVIVSRENTVPSTVRYLSSLSPNAEQPFTTPILSLPVPRPLRTLNTASTLAA